MRKSSLLLAIALLITGCQTIRYELRPPASDTGRLCVTQCSGIKETCRGNELRRARMERESCERDSEHGLRACLAGANSPETRRNCHNKKRSCSTAENTERCEGDYRQCFAGCGGTVTKIVEEN
jgi:hypothetical protein